MTIDVTPDAHAWPPAWARDLVPAGADVDESARYLAIEAGGWPSRSRPPTGAPSRWSCSRRWIPAAAGRRASISQRSATRLGAARRHRRRSRGRGAAGRSAPRAARPRAVRRTTRRLPSVHRRRRLPLSRARPASGAAPGRRADRAPGQKRQPARRRRPRRPASGPRNRRPRSTPPAGVAHRRHRRSRHGEDGAHRRHRPGLARRRPQQRRASRSRRPPARRPTVSPSFSRRDSDAPVPGTLHRLLGLSGGAVRLRGGEFRHHENRPLPYAAVIVDEASMVGLALMEQLSRALAPDARLVLIGDGDQLPAVEVGSVFRDLVATGPDDPPDRKPPHEPGRSGRRGRARRRLGHRGRQPRHARHCRRRGARTSCPSPDSPAWSRTRRRRSRRGARCPPSSITGTRPGSARAPTPPAAASRSALVEMTRSIRAPPPRSWPRWNGNNGRAC